MAEQTQETVLTLDAENNEYLRLGMNFSLLDKALREHPDIVVTMQNGLLRLDYEGYIYSVNCYGAYLDSQSLAMMALGVIDASARRMVAHSTEQS